MFMPADLGKGSPAARGGEVNWLSKWRRNRRERRILKQCGCICYCPDCGEPLQDQAIRWTCDDGMERYLCQCGAHTKWNFDAAPVPLLIGRVGVDEVVAHLLGEEEA